MKYRVYLDNGNSHNIDVVKVLRFNDTVYFGSGDMDELKIQSGYLNGVRLMVQERFIVSMEAFPDAPKKNISNFVQYVSMIEDIASKQKPFPDHMDRRDALKELRTISLDGGRMSGKIHAAIALLKKHGGALVVRTIGEANAMRKSNPDVEIYSSSEVSGMVCSKSMKKKFLVIDEVFYHTTNSEDIYRYASTFGFAHVVFLGRSV